MKYKVKLETNEIRYKEYIVDAESEDYALEVAKTSDYNVSKGDPMLESQRRPSRNVLIRTIQSPRGVEKVK